MSDTKTASLTVLGGPLAGTRCVLPESGSVTVGSDVGSTLVLDLASVSPFHARIDVEAAVGMVRSSVPKKQVSFVAARRIIAVMKDRKTGRDWSIG